VAGVITVDSAVLVAAFLGVPFVLERFEASWKLLAGVWGSSGANIVGSLVAAAGVDLLLDAFAMDGCGFFARRHFLSSVDLANEVACNRFLLAGKHASTPVSTDL
jgi:hypothetical protein